MASIVSELKQRTPKFLSNFIADISDVNLPDDWNSGDEFVTRQVKCKCGNENLILIATKENDDPKSFLLDPIFAICPSCSSRELLFSSIKHGYDGEYGHLGTDELQGVEVQFKEEPGKVYVNYSYQDEENYEDLAGEGIQNGEDYFDTLTVYFGTDEIIQVQSFECA